MKTVFRLTAAVVLCLLCMLNFCGCVDFDDSSEASDKTEVIKIVENTQAKTAQIERKNLDDFDMIYQSPELPTGCEITSLAMALNHYGFEIDKCALASDYLPTLPSADTYIGDDGLIHGNDLNSYFIGDPTDYNGYVCGAKAIATAAKAYLDDYEGGNFIVSDMSGADFGTLNSFVENEVPVIVWCTINMADRNEVEGWYNDNGEYVSWAHEDHCAVLIGCGDNTVTIADPISGIVEYGKDQFESSFKSRNRQCVVVYNQEVY